MTSATRRDVLRAAGVGVFALAGCASDENAGEWIAVESPTEMTLYDAVMTRDGVCTVGEGGRVLLRRNGGWETAVERGPTGSENALRDAAATDNGRHVWFAGDSGVVGVYDVDDDVLTDRSAPKGMTSTWEAVAAVGLADEEWVYLANGSGEVVRGTNSGGEIEWGDPVEPGGGSSLTDVAFSGHGLGFATDTSTGVYQTLDAGTTWRRIGVRRGGVNLHDVAPLGSDQIEVAGDAGNVFDYNGFTWERTKLGENALLAIQRDSHRGVVVSDSGDVFRLTGDGWTPEEASADGSLFGVTLGTSDHPTVVVGESGTIVERHT